MPIPIDMRTPKPAAQQRQDWPFWAEHACPVDPAPAAAETDDAATPRELKRPGAHEFLFRSEPDQEWQRYTPSVGRHMRNNAGEARRTNQPKSELYAREEVLEDTEFLIDITFPNGATADDFVSRFEDVLTGRAWLTLGRGGAPACITQAAFLPPLTRCALPPNADEFRLTLMSDLIVRGPRLGFLDGLDLGTLVELAGAPQDLADKITLDVECDTASVHGFNAASGLPRKTALCLRRGSVVVCSSGDHAALAALHGALRGCAALGERCSEGFGDFRVDVEPPMVASPPPERIAAHPLVTALETRLAAARAFADDLLARTDEQPSRSQWQTLLEDVRAIGSHADLVELIDHLAAHADRQAGAEWRPLVEPLRRRVVEIDAPSQATALTLLRDAIGHILRDERLAQAEDRG